MGLYKDIMIGFIIVIILYIITHLMINPPSEIKSRMLKGFQADHLLFVPYILIGIGAVFYFLKKLF